PYKRTMDTAVLIAVAHLAQRWMADDRLEELHFGEWEGLTYEQAEQRNRDLLWAWYDDPWSNSPPEGESLGELQRRVAEWVQVITQAEMAEENMLVVSHGGPLRWFLAEHVLGDREQFHALKWEPGQVVICSYAAGVWKLEQGEVHMR
ncbi:MAG: histidine phosphatase family protein, partial [Tumebacillaceae bacterium]